MAPHNIVDPKTKYPKPPYKKQEQPWPGMASKMEPPPDHGEKSYPGSGRLAGRKALITGGDSGMGRAAAIAYAREGADVAINYFPSEVEDAQEVIVLVEAEGRIGLGIPGDLRRRDVLRGVGQAGYRRIGRSRYRHQQCSTSANTEVYPDVPSEDFDATMKTNIYAPFWIIKAALPRQARRGHHRYIF